MAAIVRLFDLPSDKFPKELIYKVFTGLPKSYKAEGFCAPAALTAVFARIDGLEGFNKVVEELKEYSINSKDPLNGTEYQAIVKFVKKRDWVPINYPLKIGITFRALFNLPEFSLVLRKPFDPNAIDLCIMRSARPSAPTGHVFAFNSGEIIDINHYKHTLGEGGQKKIHSVFAPKKHESIIKEAFIRHANSTNKKVFSKTRKKLSGMLSALLELFPMDPLNILEELQEFQQVDLRKWVDINSIFDFMDKQGFGAHSSFIEYEPYLSNQEFFDNWPKGIPALFITTYPLGFYVNKNGNKWKTVWKDNKENNFIRDHYRGKRYLTIKNSVIIYKEKDYKELYEYFDGQIYPFKTDIHLNRGFGLFG